MAPAADLMSDDLYDVLAVARNASASEINKAYRRLAQKHHPDKNLSRKQAAEEEFKRIAAAYEVLSCPEKRKQYDQFGKAVMERSSKHGPEDLEERQEAARAVAAAKKAVAAARAAAAAQVAQQRKQSRLAKEKEEQLRKKEKKAKKLVGASMAPAKKEGGIAQKALDQSRRYVDLSLDEATLIEHLGNFQSILVDCVVMCSVCRRLGFGTAIQGTESTCWWPT